MGLSTFENSYNRAEYQSGRRRKASCTPSTVSLLNSIACIDTCCCFLTCNSKKLLQRSPRDRDSCGHCLHRHQMRPPTSWPAFQLMSSTAPETTAAWCRVSHGRWHRPGAPAQDAYLPPKAPRPLMPRTSAVIPARRRKTATASLLGFTVFMVAAHQATPSLVGIPPRFLCPTHQSTAPTKRSNSIECQSMLMCEPDSHVASRQLTLPRQLSLRACFCTWPWALRHMSLILEELLRLARIMREVYLTLLGSPSISLVAAETPVISTEAPITSSEAATQEVNTEDASGHHRGSTTPLVSTRAAKTLVPSSEAATPEVNAEDASGHHRGSTTPLVSTRPAWEVSTEDASGHHSGSTTPVVSTRAANTSVPSSEAAIAPPGVRSGQHLYLCYSIPIFLGGGFASLSVQLYRQKYGNAADSNRLPLKQAFLIGAALAVVSVWGRDDALLNKILTHSPDSINFLQAIFGGAVIGGQLFLLLLMNDRL